jgi:C1A family cysteine protease
MSFPYKLGLRRSPKDSNELKLCAPPNKFLPLKYEIPIVRCIYTQGDINSCSSNVICNQIMALKHWSDNNYPSRLFQYYVSRSISGNEKEDEGCSYREAYQGLAKFGFTDENFWSYDTSKVFEKPTEEAYKNANTTLVKKYKSVLQCQYSLKFAICEGHVVAFGSMLYENFQPDVNGVIPLPKGNMVGGHAMAIIGYDDEKKLFNVLNSWGSNWGLNGCCFMKYEHVLNNEWCFDFYVLTKE